ncbi:DUF7115 domain-containing protein [Halobellus rubicundus]|uniref:DUF7115 domain-containing protein n=1 Tax=Halobellus rubicundus TaxID=2996466 RepID=A0ABD5MF69_9EURY
MSQPEIVQSDLAGEDVVARVDLGGEDELYVTPTRTLLYRAEGLLSDESVEEYPHEAERITVSEGRRKAKVTLDYGLDGEATISLPAKRLDRALPPIVEGVLRANGILDDDEDIERLFRFSELTIVIAGKRVVRHIGGNLWDEDFESYHYGDVTDLAFEDGSVATSVVLTVDGRQERFKAPNEDARAVRAALETTLLSYWEVDSLGELRAAAEPDEPDGEGEPEPEPDRNVSFGDGPDPLIADPAEPEELPENATRESDDGGQGGEPGVQADAGNAPGGSDSATGADQATQHIESSPATEASAGTRSGRQENGSSGASADVPGSEAPRGGSETETETEPETAWADSIQESTGAPSAESPRRGQDAPTTHEEPPRGSGGAESPETGFEGSGFESAAPADEQLREELAELREAVERQNQELRAQRELVEQLIEELRRGR